MSDKKAKYNSWNYRENTKCVDRLINWEYPKNIFFKIQGVILHA